MSGLSGLLQCPWKRPITNPFLCWFLIAAVALPFPGNPFVDTHTDTHTHSALGSFFDKWRHRQLKMDSSVCKSYNIPLVPLTLVLLSSRRIHNITHTYAQKSETGNCFMHCQINRNRNTSNKSGWDREMVRERGRERGDRERGKQQAKQSSTRIRAHLTRVPAALFGQRIFCAFQHKWNTHTHTRRGKKTFLLENIDLPAIKDSCHCYCCCTFTANWALICSLPLRTLLLFMLSTHNT